MISVIISTHDGRRKMLEEAVNSVLNQSFQDFEIVVVDDASKDDTKAYMADLCSRNPKIKYIRREENFGNDTKPKNEGILESEGEYIAFLDSDNTYRIDHLASLYMELKDSDYDVVYGDRMVIDGVTGDKMGMGVASNFDPFILLRRNYIDTSDVLIKRQALYDVGGFDESISKFIDWNLWVRMAKYGHRFKRVQKLLTNYTIHDNQKSQTNKAINTFDPIDCEIVLPYLGSRIPDPRVAIFSLTYDRLELTKECFQSLKDTAGYPYEHFIVDNGSTDGTVEYLKELESSNDNVHLILNEDNRGISIASNQALDAIGDEFDVIMKVDNDAFFKSDGWLDKMVEIYQSNHRLALSCYVEGLRDNPGGAPREAYGEIKGELVGMARHLGGICHFVEAKAYENFRWDEEDTLHGMQDVELSQHLTLNGYQMAYLENWYVEHRYGTSGQHEKFPSYFERRKSEKTTTYNEMKDTKKESDDIEYSNDTKEP